MERKVYFLNVLSSHDFFQSSSLVAISPLFNILCVVQKNRDAIIHMLPFGSEQSPAWICPSKTKNCLFSEDGKLLLFLLSVNSIHLYKIGDDVSMTGTVQIKASTLANILKEHSVDYSSISDVLPLRLRRSELLLRVDGRLISLEWGLPGSDPTVRFAVPLPQHIDSSLSSSKLLLLENNSSWINTTTGLKCAESLNLGYAEKTNPDFSIGKNFSKCAIHPTNNIVAVVNLDEAVLLFDMSEAFDRVEPKPTPEDLKKDRWWTMKKPPEEKNFPGHALALVPPPPGVVVSRIEFTLHGLSIYYSVMGASNYSSAVIVRATTGQILCTMNSLVGYSLVQGARLPVFQTNSSISICIGPLSSVPFNLELCDLLKDVCKKEISDDSTVVRGLLTDREDGDVCVDFMKTILNLHSNTYRRDLKKICEENIEEATRELIKRSIISRLEKLCSLVMDVEEELHLTAFVFLHLVHLLDLTCLCVKGSGGGVQLPTLHQLCVGFLKRLFLMYPTIKDLELLRYEWMVWRGMSENEVVQEAVVLGTVALSLVFFVTERKWNAERAIDKFRELTEGLILQMTAIGDLEKATLALNTIGCDPLIHFKNLCLDTTEPLLRDLLVTHLRDAGRFSEGEESAWKFCKQIENSLSSHVSTQRVFEHKMTVAATETADVVMFKLVPFKGSLELRTVLNQNQRWRDIVLTELYFATADVTLECHLDKDLSWRHLLENNTIELLQHWVDVTFLQTKPQSMDYVTKLLVAMLGRWSVTEDMLEVIHKIDCMTATKEFVLDRAAGYGVFSTTEKVNIPAVVKRLRNTCNLAKITEILKRPVSNVSMGDVQKWFLTECAKHDVKMPVMSCLRDANNSGELDAFTDMFPWLPLWREFEKWDGVDTSVLPNLIRKSTELFPMSSEEAPFVKIALAQIEGTEIVNIIKNEGPDCDLLKIVPMEICWQSLQRSRAPDVTLYDLLAGSRLPVERLFSWQTENTYVMEPHKPESFPHFNHQVLSAKYGHKQHLDYLYYIKQGRPSFACNLFFVESLRTHKRLTTQMISRACGLAHGLALRSWKEETVGRSCVAFIAMLGDYSAANALRLHLGAISLVSAYVPEEQKQFIGNLLYGIVTKDAICLQDMACLLEAATFQSIADLEKLEQLKQWSLPVTFCIIHGLPMPTLLPRAFAKQQDWFHFVLCLDLFKYPYDLAIELIEEIAPVLKAHMLRALTRTTLKLATSPSKSPPRIRLDPDSGAEEEVKDSFQAFVRHVYTEVLTTIQTFTDRNIVLPWSCEQNPDEDVLLTVLKCESTPDPAEAMLLSALDLNSPVLALLSTCYNHKNPAAPLLAWLMSSLPSTLPKSYLREDSFLLLFDRDFSQESFQNILLQFFETGFFQTFYRAMMLFLPDNPITFVVEGIYRCVKELDDAGALSALKAFVVEMVHGQGRIKDSVLGSRDWIISTTARLIESIISRSDVAYSTKAMFLRVLADSEISSVDDTLPKYLTWHQVTEVLAPVQVKVDMARLYDVNSAPEEMERYFKELIAKQAFTVGLEICELLSINKDRINVALWTHNIKENIQNNDISYLWAQSAQSFSDENVCATKASKFYLEMVGLITGESSIDLKNKYLGLRYCLSWRKGVEESLSSAFREESDSIELQLWEVALKEKFDYGVFDNFNSARAFAMLVDEWPPEKLLVRAAPNAGHDPSRISSLIAALLDTGDLQRALRVSAFFTHEHQDLKTICSCLQVALNELPESELAQYSSLLSPKKLLTPAIDTTDFEVSTKEPPPVLALLERLCASVNHGKNLAMRICTTARLAFSLDQPFETVAAVSNCLVHLERPLPADCGSKMAIARDVVWLARLPDSSLAEYLSEKIVNAFDSRAETGLDIPARLWDVNLDENFHRIIMLMENPANLGLKLLQAVGDLSFPAAVEVLIKAHDCYSVACNVEGIGMVLGKARVLSQQILQAQQWRHLVRLLVGVGRYSDMSYIFQMLRDNDQFEHLLRKGTTKTPTLHLAVSDFLHRTCPEDKELAKMVALAYGLHGRQADLWLAEAEDLLRNLTPPLKDSSKTRQMLTLAMENYSHAAMCCLDAGKPNKALRISRKAQLVALQISLLGGPYVFNITQQQLQEMAQETLGVSQILLLLKTKDMQLDWIAVLHERWVVHGDKTVYNDMKTSGILTPRLVSHYLSKYENFQCSGRVKDRLKQLSLLFSVPSPSQVK